MFPQSVQDSLRARSRKLENGSLSGVGFKTARSFSTRTRGDHRESCALTIQDINGVISVLNLPTWPELCMAVSAEVPIETGLLRQHIGGSLSLSPDRVWPGTSSLGRLHKRIPEFPRKDYGGFGGWWEPRSRSSRKLKSTAKYPSRRLRSGDPERRILHGAEDAGAGSSRLRTTAAEYPTSKLKIVAEYASEI